MRYLYILLAAYFLSSTIVVAQTPTLIPPSSQKFPSDSHVQFGDLYGTAKFRLAKLDIKVQQEWFLRIVEALFGQKDAGQYVIVVELKDPTKAGQNVIARQVVADFEIVDETTFLWDNKRLNEISKASWNADLISKIRVDAKTN